MGEKKDYPCGETESEVARNYYVALTHVMEVLEADTELLDKAREIMRSDKPYSVYHSDGFAEKVESAVGFHVEPSRFVEAMAYIVHDFPSEKREQLIDEAIQFEKEDKS